LRTVLDTEDAHGGALITTSDFTDGAFREQEKLSKRMSLRDVDDIRD
jgi:hypothetical protein